MFGKINTYISFILFSFTTFCRDDTLTSYLPTKNEMNVADVTSNR